MTADFPPELARAFDAERPPDAGFDTDPDDHPYPAPLDAQSHLFAFELDLRSGRPWFDALLECIQRWHLPRETVDDTEYHYLIDDEAFDWLLLAQRICDSVPDDLLPCDQVDALLLDETPPGPLAEADFQAGLGPSKYWAHLNFLYGVRVEQALQLAVERSLHKERGAVRFDHARPEPDDDLFARIYGAPQSQLLADFRDAHDRAHTDRIGQSELHAFTYWLFRRRLQRQDPARIASDTRQGLDMMRELEQARQRRRALRAAAATPPPTDDDLIEAVVVAVG